jgi:hypothetical protein
MLVMVVPITSSTATPSASIVNGSGAAGRLPQRLKLLHDHVGDANRGHRI